MTPIQDLAALDTEADILSLMLCKPNEIIPRVRVELTENDFFRESHKVMFSGLLEMFKDGEPIDITTVVPYFQKKGIVEKVGGIIGIRYFYEKTLGLGYLDSYLGTVKDRARRKHSIELMDIAIAEARDITEDFNIHAHMAKLSEVMKEKYLPEKTIKDIGAEFLDEICRRTDENTREPRMGSSIPDLDSLIHGFKKPELIYIAARPGMGKSALAVQMTVKAALDQNLSVLYASLEMGDIAIFSRMVASLTSIDSKIIMNDNDLANRDDFTVIAAAADKLTKAKIHIKNLNKKTPAELYNQALQIQAKHGLDAIIIDHVHLMNSGIKGDESNPTTNMTHISNALLGMTKEFNIPIIALAQLSRGVEQRNNKRPVMSDLRDSGTLEQDADKIIMLYREKYYQEMEGKSDGQPDIVDVIVQKNREGQTGTVSVLFEKEYSRMMPLGFAKGVKYERSDFTPPE